MSLVVPRRSLLKLSVSVPLGSSPHLIIYPKGQPSAVLADAYGDLFMGKARTVVSPCVFFLPSSFCLLSVFPSCLLFVSFLSPLCSFSNTLAQIVYP